MTREVLPPRGRIDLFLTDLILRGVLRKFNRERPNSGMPEYTRELKDIFLDFVRKRGSSPNTEDTAELPMLRLKPEPENKKSSTIEKTMTEGVEALLNK